MSATGECHYNAWKHIAYNDGETDDRIMVGYVRTVTPGGSAYWMGHWWNEDAEGNVTSADVMRGRG